MGGNGKTLGGFPRSSCHAESSPERKFPRNVWAASSREPTPAHHTFASPSPHRASARALVCVTLKLSLWEWGPPGSLSPSSGWGGSSGLWEDPGLITSVTPSTLRKVLWLSLLLLETWVGRGGEG